MEIVGSNELVDIVDEHDMVLRREPRHVMRRDRLRHRAVFVLVRDGLGRVLIHRRSEMKDLWPGWWDIAIGGVVTTGETYESAAERELAEEAGIEAKPVFVCSGKYEDDDVRLVGCCYEVVHDGPVEPRDGEIVEFAWVSITELTERIQREKFLPDSLALLGGRLFGS